MAFPLKPRIPQVNWGNPLTKGLVFDMPFFEGGGTKSNELAKENNGSFTSGITWSKDLYGTATSFPATTSDRVNCGTNVAGLYNRNPFTWMALVKVNSANSTNRIIIHDSSTGANHYEVWLQLDTTTTNNLAFGYYNGSTYIQATWVTGWVAGSTHLIFGIWDGKTTRIYVDGDINHKATAAQTSPPGGSGTPITCYIGSHVTNANQSWDGKIYLIRMWSRALNKSEIKQLYTDPFQIYIKPKGEF